MSRHINTNTSELTKYAEAVVHFSGKTMDELFLTAGLDITVDLRYFDWSNIDFRGSNLFGFDFTGARLDGCKFGGARIKGATFDDDFIASEALSCSIDYSEYSRPIKNKAFISKAFRRCKTKYQADRFLKNHKHLTLFSSAHDINAYIMLHQDYKSAVGLLNLFSEHGIKPNYKTFDWLGHAAESSKKNENPNARVEQTIELAKQWQIQPSARLYSRVIGTAPTYDDALRLSKEMLQGGLPIDQFAYASLIERSPSFVTAVDHYLEMTRYKKLKPIVETFNAMVIACDNLQSARRYFNEIEKQGLQRNVYSYDALLSKIWQPGYKNSKNNKSLYLGQKFFSLMKKEGIAPIQTTYSELMRLAPNLNEVLGILKQMKKERIWPDMRTLNFAAYRARNIESASRLKQEIPSRVLIPTTFFETIYTNLTPFEDAESLLTWAFAKSTSNPHRPKEGAWEVAIRRYCSSPENRLPQALRIALAFPHLDAARELFLAEKDHSYDYFEQEYLSGKEPHHGANAIAHVFLAHEEFRLAIEWFKKSLLTDKNTAQRRVKIQEKIISLQSALVEQGNI